MRAGRGRRVDELDERAHARACRQNRQLHMLLAIALRAARGLHGGTPSALRVFRVLRVQEFSVNLKTLHHLKP